MVVFARKDEIDAVIQNTTTPFEGYRTGFFENLDATYNKAKWLDTFDAHKNSLIKVLEPYVAEGDENPAYFYDLLNGGAGQRPGGTLTQRPDIDEASMPELPYAEFRRRMDKMNRALRD